MLKLLQISDLHIMPNSTDTLYGINTESTFQQVLQHAHLNYGQFDVILVTGDLVQEPSIASYQRIKQILQVYQTPCLCLPGNHDDLCLMQAVLNTDNLSCQPILQLDNWQIICMETQMPDSPNGYLAANQLTFLEKSLENYQLPTLLAMHHPCISCGCPWLDSMQISNSNILWDIISQFSQVKAITFGHIHQEIAEYHQGVTVFSAPASCFQFQQLSSSFALAENKAAGYRVFELMANGEFNSKCDWLI